MGPRAGLDGEEKIASTDIRSPDLPVRSESLYRLRYPDPQSYHRYQKSVSGVQLDGRRTGPRLGPDAMAKSRILTKVGNGTPTRHPTVGQSLY